MGFAPSRSAARQIISHKHISVNGRKVNIPSFLVSVGDVVEIKESSRTMPLIQEAMESAVDLGTDSWLKVDKDAFKGEILSLPSRDQIMIDTDERLIVEYYSK